MYDFPIELKCDLKPWNNIKGRHHNMHIWTIQSDTYHPVLHVHVCHWFLFPAAVATPSPSNIGYRPGDMALLGLIMAAVLVLCFIVIGFLVSRLWKGNASMDKICEVRKFAWGFDFDWCFTPLVPWICVSWSSSKVILDSEFHCCFFLSILKFSAKPTSGFSANHQRGWQLYQINIFKFARVNVREDLVTLCLKVLS